MRDYMAKSIRVFIYHMRSRFFTGKTAVVFLLVFIFLNRAMRPIAEYCFAVGRAVTPWVFPFLTSDYICQAFLAAGGVLLLAEIPFKDSNRMYMLCRCGTVAWQTGTILYTVCASVIYVVSVFFLCLLNLADVMSFSFGWGKILVTLAQTDVRFDYGVPVTFASSVLQFSPIKAAGLSVVLEALCILWLALLMYIGNDLIGKKTGLLLAFIYVFLDGIIYNVMSRSAYRMSPVSLSQLSYFNGDMAREGVTMGYAFAFFGVSFLLFTAVILISGSRQRIRARLEGRRAGSTQRRR